MARAPQQPPEQLTPQPQARGLFGIGGSRGEWAAYATQVVNQLLMYARRGVAAVEELRAEQRSHPERFIIGDSAQAAPGTATATMKTRVPMGKRLVLRRIATSGPMGASCVIYDNTGNDATSQIEVIAGAALYADGVLGEAVVKGGRDLVAVFSNLGAAGGQVTVRYEGDLYEDRPEV